MIIEVKSEVCPKATGVAVANLDHREAVAFWRAFFKEATKHDELKVYLDSIRKVLKDEKTAKEAFEVLHSLISRT